MGVVGSQSYWFDSGLDVNQFRANFWAKGRSRQMPTVLQPTFLMPGIGRFHTVLVSPLIRASRT